MAADVEAAGANGLGPRLRGLRTARSGHTATLLADGSVLIAGGRNAAGVVVRAAELFDPGRPTTRQLRGRLVASRGDHSATLLPQGQVLFVAGDDGLAPLASAEVYSPSSNSFSLLRPTILTARSGHTATLLLDGRVLILGGTRSSGATLAEGESFDPTPDPHAGDIYDPETGDFREIPDALAVPRTQHTATLLPSGEVLVIGGTSGVAFAPVEVLDPATHTATLLAASLATPRAGHTATLLPDGSVLVAGGRGEAGLLDSVEVYDPETRSFSTSPVKLEVARANHTATLLPGGILIAGGDDGDAASAHTELVGPLGGDHVAPRLRATLPPADATHVPLNTIVGIRFSEPLRTSAVPEGGVDDERRRGRDRRTWKRRDPKDDGGAGRFGAVELVLIGPDGVQVEGTSSSGGEGLYAFFVPFAPLAPGTGYVVKADGGEDLAGNPLDPVKLAFTTAPEPSISAFSPASGPAGTVVTVLGGGFAPTPDLNEVAIGRAAATVRAVTPTKLAITVPAEASAGSARITVQTAGGRAESADRFVVENPAPRLEWVDPLQVAAGSPEVALALGGAQFVPNSVVHFNGMRLATRYLGATKLEAAVPASLLTTAGAFPVRVVNPRPGGGSSESIDVTVVASDPPAIAGISPGSGPTAGGVEVTLTGSDFGLTPTLVFGGAAVPITFSSHAELRFVLPPGEGTRDVQVVVDGQPSNTVSFRYDAPAIAGISPATGPTAGGVEVTLTGSDFGLTPTLIFGGAVVPITVSSHAELRFVLPPGEGTRDVQVVVAGQPSNTVSFRYDAPAIAGISPATGPTAGGVEVALTGSDFGLTPTLIFGGAAVPITFSSHAELRFVLPPGEATRDVQVVVDGQPSNTVSFRYDAPAIAGISPATGPTAGGVEVTLTGSDFGLTPTLIFGGAVVPITVSSHAELRFVLPPGEGTRDVQVVVDGQPSNTVSFRYDPPAIAGISPGSGPTAGGVEVTLTGSDFGLTPTLVFGGTAVPITVSSHAELRFVLPPGEGTRDVQVVVAGQPSNTVSFRYDAPAIAGISPGSGPTAGGVEVTLTGSDFGLTPTLVFGGTAVPITFSSHAELRFVLPPGEGTRDVQVVVAGQPSNTVSFRYDAPWSRP